MSSTVLDMGAIFCTASAATSHRASIGRLASIAGRQRIALILIDGLLICILLSLSLVLIVYRLLARDPVSCLARRIGFPANSWP